MKAAQVDVVRDSMSEVFDGLQRAATPAIKQSKRQAGAILDQSGELIDTVANQACEAAAEISKSLVSNTKKHPLIALSLAVGVGAMLIGAARSMQSRR